ncbi:MAG: sigma-70 family RNA polymerase sigma factor [Bacteroidota bacterium]
MTEEKLMEAVKHGDLKKASAIFDLYHKRMYNFFVKITLDRELGHDLTQNLFLRLIKYRGSYKEGMKFQSWFFQMARNVYADHFRKTKFMYSDFTDIERLGEYTHGNDEENEQTEREKLLYRSLGKLDEEDRELLVLSRFQKLKYEEISQVMDISVANVKVKVHRAIKKLRDNYFQLEKC